MALGRLRSNHITIKSRVTKIAVKTDVAIPTISVTPNPLTGPEPRENRITAVIRAKQGSEDIMRQGLLDVAENVQKNEPDTIDFFICQDPKDPCVFTTYERFTDQAAMDLHNNSEAVARFFGIAKPLLDGDVVLVTCNEISAKA